MANGPVTFDPRESVRWAYRLLLGREPEDDATITAHLQAAGGAAPEALRRRIMESEEFRGGEAAASAMPAHLAIGPLDGMLGEPAAAVEGCFTDRFGVRTRVAYLPPPYQAYAGQVGAPDGSDDMPLHEPAELNALLRAISEAQGSFAAMELGAGWGPWVVLGGQLARRRGLPLALTGVEGSIDHLGFMRTHFLDNGFDPAAHQLIHAVVGAVDGVAQFPRLPDPSADWGAEARFNEAEAAGQDMEEVTCFSLATLLAGAPVLDLIHCDVQGAEADVFEAGMESVDQRVRRVCIGTHGRGVEGRLLDLFAAHGWVLEDEKPCSLVQSGTRMALRADGVQVWRNPRGI